MNNRERKQLAATEIILTILAVLLLAGVVWFAWLRPQHTSSVNSFEECVAAGNPIMESYPEQCVTKDGKHFTKPSK